MQTPHANGQHPFNVQAWLAAIVASSDDAIVSKTLEGIITSWNQGAERIFGYTADEMIGKPMTTIFPPDRYEEEPQILARLARGERVDHFETIRRTKDGRLIDVSVTISPIRNEAGVIIGASKIARDISFQKQAERDLRQARDDAKAAQLEAERANQAKDHFLSALSHELRTPLTPVLGAISVMETTADLTSDDIGEYLTLIRRNVETQARLIDDLLDMTRISRGKLALRTENMDVHAAIRNVASMLQSDVDAKGLELAFSLNAKHSEVLADPGRFQQILLNLLSNAIKFTPSGRKISFYTSDEAGSDRWLKIEVVDQGIGISPEIIHKLFQPFEQGEKSITRQFGGLGLGLSIARSLAGYHGASLMAASEGLGKGATFTLRIKPNETAPKPSPNAPSFAANELEQPLEGCHVLLVEDHPDTRMLLLKVLNNIGCRVTAVGSVREAIEAFDRDGFNLLVSDIGLPDGTGLQVMQHARHRQNVRGIALSGFGQEADLERSRQAGFDRHLVKPLNLKVLSDVIRELQDQPAV